MWVLTEASSAPLDSLMIAVVAAGEGKEEEEAVERDGESMNGSTQEKSTAPTKPNVFFIMIDDMGWDDIGYQSLDLQGTTPNLDRLAAGGIKVTNATSTPRKRSTIPRTKLRGRP